MEEWEARGDALRREVGFDIVERNHDLVVSIVIRKVREVEVQTKKDPKPQVCRQFWSREELGKER